MFVSFCLFECFFKCHVFACKVSPAGAALTDIDMDESLFRVDSDSAVPEALDLCGEFVHTGHREIFDDDICGVAQQVLASFSTADSLVVFGAPVSASDPNRGSGEITEFLKRGYKERIDLRFAATPTGEFAS
jgi:hypothetical protein